MTLRVGLITADALVKSGLESTLAAEPDFDIAASALCAEHFTRAAAGTHLDVVVIYPNAGDTGLADTVRHVTADRPGQPMLVLVAGRDKDGDAIRQPDVSVVTRDNLHMADLAAMIRITAAGRLILDRDRLTALTARRPLAASDAPSHLQLTEREREVLDRISTGMTNTAIARDLSVARSTVKTHVESILKKLGVTTRVQAAILAAGSPPTVPH